MDMKGKQKEMKGKQKGIKGKQTTNCQDNGKMHFFKRRCDPSFQWYYRERAKPIKIFILGTDDIGLTKHTPAFCNS